MFERKEDEVTLTFNLEVRVARNDDSRSKLQNSISRGPLVPMTTTLCSGIGL